MQTFKFLMAVIIRPYLFWTFSFWQLIYSPALLDEKFYLEKKNKPYKNILSLFPLSWRRQALLSGNKLGPVMTCWSPSCRARVVLAGRWIAWRSVSSLQIPERETEARSAVNHFDPSSHQACTGPSSAQGPWVRGCLLTLHESAFSFFSLHQCK